MYIYIYIYIYTTTSTEQNIGNTILVYPDTVG